MDPEAFLDLANQVAKLKMYPYFELAHAAVVCLTIKEDMGSGNPHLNMQFKGSIFYSITEHNYIHIYLFFFILGAQAFSRKHPLSCWFSTMFTIFAGSILANLLLGEPCLTPFKNNNQLLLATSVW